MAHVHKPQPRQPYGRKYPWDRWFGKQWFRVTRGRDYECTTTSFVQQIRNAAGLRNLSVRISLLCGPKKEEVVVTVGQVVEPDQVLKGAGGEA